MAHLGGLAGDLGMLVCAAGRLFGLASLDEHTANGGFAGLVHERST